MDPAITGPVGFVSSVISLCRAAQDLYDFIRRLQGHERRCSQLLTQVDELKKSLESARSTSDAAAALISSSLCEVKSTLEPLDRRRWCVLRCCTASGDEAKFQKAENALENLKTLVVVRLNFLQLKDEIPQIYNGTMALPHSSIGLDRAGPLLDFLETSKFEELRVMGIHGLPGVGKSTLLNYIWNEASSKEPFARRAHIQIGHNAASKNICSLQSSMLRQLGGRNYEFTSSDGGRQQLSQHFRQLRDSKEAVFLAIDNVFEAEDIQELLPSNISKDLLPAFSCIAITSRDNGVVRSLLSICNLNEKNYLQVFRYTPECLDLEKSKAVFAACGDLRITDDAEIMDALVPLCKGLPLVLTVLGTVFSGNMRRERKEWESIKGQMLVLDGEDSETKPVTNSLRISYTLLTETRKAAFLDVVNVFNGWPWDRVERIMGGNVMKDLKDSSLILEADDWSNCNQSMLRVGYDLDLDNFQSGTKPVVTMHDLILKFGEHVHILPIISRTLPGSQYGESLLKEFEAQKLRNLIVWRDSTPVSESVNLRLMELLGRTPNLQMLFLWKTVELASGNFEIRANHTDIRQQGLRFLRLVAWESSSLFMEMKLSPEIREIHLHACNDLVHLPDRALCKLEWLSIKNCANFEGFTDACVEKWQKLQYLQVCECESVKNIPKELGCLRNLRHLEFAGLFNLETLPVISSPLERLELQDIPITDLKLETSSLEILKISRCRNLKQLPHAISDALSLRELILESCQSLVGIPDNVPTSLTELDVSGCRDVKELPRAIGSASSLRELRLRGCQNLEELPDEVGMLTSLTDLDLSWCRSLKVLPSSIGNASSLQRLSLERCEILEELPEEVGKLALLTELDVSGCRNLKELPFSIRDCVSLRELRMHRCENLKALSDGVGKLTSLIKLDVSRCRNLRELPSSIGDALSLRELRLQSCESLERLPEEVGTLPSLTELDLSYCTNLRELPLSIGNVPSLRKLDLSGCDNLAELPDEMMTKLRNSNVHFTHTRGSQVKLLSVFPKKLAKR